MKNNKLNGAIIIGFLAIVGILIAQLLWTKQAFSLEEKKFSQKAHIALLEVAKKLYQGINHELPVENPVRKISNDYYVVNIDNDFEPEILEFYLKTEFVKINIPANFEYAVYNCQSDEMIYGGYVTNIDNDQNLRKVMFPKHKNLIYYFAIRFPNQTNYLLESFTFWIILTGVLILILLLYSYSIFSLLQQKKYADLQRDFVNNMTHEFKTPLSSIMIASQFLQKNELIINEDKLSKYNQIVIDQGNKLNNHIDKILNLSKTDLKPFQLDITDVDIIKTIQETIKNIALQYHAAQISIIDETHLDEICIKTDAFHFVNLVYNIIENGIKYNNQKVAINIHLSLQKNKLLIQFKDNGIGILQENKSKIFEKFVRIQTTKSNDTKGFGLGLYYVKNICKFQKWTISVSDNSPIGSIFYIEIPF